VKAVIAAGTEIPVVREIRGGVHPGIGVTGRNLTVQRIVPGVTQPLHVHKGGGLAA